MSFWNPRKSHKPKPPPLDTGQAVPARKKIHRSPPIAFEAKMLAIEALDCGADRQDVAQLAELQRMVDAEKSDLYDVLAYVAFTTPPISRAERVDLHKGVIYGQFGGKQRAFLDFVLEQYINQGVGELDQDKLPGLLELKYQAVTDAVTELGGASVIREMFVGFQKHLYSDQGVA